MKKFMIVATCALCFAPLMAEEASPENVEATAQICEEEKDASTLLNEFLESKGWTEGINYKGNSSFIVQIGIGAIAAPVTHPSYIDSRASAFDKAILDAKAKLAKSLEESIETAVESRYVEPGKEVNDAETQMAKAVAAAAPDSLLGKSGALLHAKLDAALEKSDPQYKQKMEDKEAAKQKLNAIASTEEFIKSIAASATSCISGAQAYYTVEVAKGKKAEIGVVVIWSDKLATMASSMVTGKPIPGAKAKKPIREQITADKNVLLSTFGIQQMVNEKGEYVLVSFGQSSARTDSSRAAQAAYDKASLAARAQIRQFAGEYVAVEEAQERAEKTMEYDDGSLPDYNDFSSYQQYQKAVAAKMQINGIAPIKKWNAKHPMTGKTVYGVVCTWSPSAAELVRMVKKEIESTARDGAAGKRTVPAGATPTTAAPAAIPTATERIQSGASGDDDAF